MQSKLLTSLAVAFLLACVAGAGGSAAPDDKASLQGIWNAKSMEVDGKPAPAEAVKLMRFTFKGGNVSVRGNFNDDREEECSYAIDATKSPKHIDIKPPKEDKSILGIYDIKGDELKLACGTPVVRTGVHELLDQAGIN